MTMKKILSFGALVCAAALSACVETNKDAMQDITAPAPSAKIKFFNYAVGGPNVNFYANTTKMTAISSATGIESTLGIAYGATAAGGLYAGLEPGPYTLSGKISATTDKDLSIASLPTTLEAGKAYSYYLSGLYNTTGKSSESFIVEDPIPAVNYEMASVRFVNAVSNSSPMILYAKSTVTGVETAIGGSVGYKSAGTFVAVPGAVYDLSLRAPGSSTNLVTLAGASFSAGRVYTVGVRGQMNATGTNAPTLTTSINF